MQFFPALRKFAVCFCKNILLTVWNGNDKMDFTFLSGPVQDSVVNEYSLWGSKIPSDEAQVTHIELTYDNITVLGIQIEVLTSQGTFWQWLHQEV
jgi:hypothetical protein